MQDLYIFELWKRVVEMYSTTELSVETDKLVALAGIATHFHRHLFSGGADRHYIAGLWSQNLESQLLWSVNDVFNPAAGAFENPAKRVSTRAPSFSWAAIDTPLGITYGDVTDYGAGSLAHNKRSTLGRDLDSSKPSEQLFFRVLGWDITLFDEQNPFGMVKAGHLIIKPRYLRRIVLEKLPKKRSVPYSWSLKPDAAAEAPSRRKEYMNINLDAPDSDIDIFRHDADLYVMPAAFGPRTEVEEDRHLYCLLLKSDGLITLPARNGTVKYRGFQRIGITKLSSGEAERDETTLRGIETDEVICLL
jgi:hypothetical protein